MFQLIKSILVLDFMAGTWIYIVVDFMKTASVLTVY